METEFKRIPGANSSGRRALWNDSESCWPCSNWLLLKCRNSCHRFAFDSVFSFHLIPCWLKQCTPENCYDSLHDWNGRIGDLSIAEEKTRINVKYMTRTYTFNHPMQRNGSSASQWKRRSTPERTFHLRQTRTIPAAHTVHWRKMVKDQTNVRCTSTEKE